MPNTFNKILMNPHNINTYALAQIENIKNKCKNIKPVVAIRCTAYNHEEYLRDALEGFLKQKTDFPFVAIVHDDASTDTTTEIIKEYAAKYPDIILPIFEKENQYSQRNGSLSRIMDKACEVTGAKYIALCEGDDYWTDPLKLQKQVSFLESNKDYSMCFHRVEIKREGISDNLNMYNVVKDREYTANEIFEKWIIPTCSAVFKFDIFTLQPSHPDFLVGDNVLWATCLSEGKIRGLHESMGVYRRVSSGWTARAYSSREHGCETSKKWISHYKAMAYCFPKIEKKIFDNLIIEKQATVSSLELLLRRKDFFKDFRTYYKEYGFDYIKSFSTIILSRILSISRIKKILHFHKDTNKN